MKYKGTFYEKADYHINSPLFALANIYGNERLC